MHNQKPVAIKKSFDLLPGRDDDIIEFFSGPVSYSEAVRRGLRLLIAQEESREAFEIEVLDLLEQIIGALAGGAVVPKDVPETDKYNDPFLSKSL